MNRTILVCTASIFLGSCGGASSGTQAAQTTTPPVATTPTTTGGDTTPTNTTDPNVGDANSTPAAPTCAYTLCENFESAKVGGVPDPNIWAVSLDTNTDVLAVSTTEVQQGNNALHIHVDNGNGKHAMIMNKSAFPFAKDMFWGRAYVYFGSTLPTNHTTYVAAGPNPNPYEWIRYSTFGGNLGGNDSGPDNSATTNKAAPIKAWTCLEWQFDGPNQVAHYFLDSNTLTTLNIEKSGNSNNIKFAEIELGFELYEQSGSASGWDMYLDNIALDANRIGCNP